MYSYWTVDSNWVSVSSAEKAELRVSLLCSEKKEETPSGKERGWALLLLMAGQGRYPHLGWNSGVGGSLLLSWLVLGNGVTTLFPGIPRRGW